MHADADGTHSADGALDGAWEDLPACYGLPLGSFPDDAQGFGALYIHVPFCARRCLYCDFPTRAVDLDAPEIREYSQTMVRSIRRAAHDGLLSKLDSVYIGGGTPTFIGQRALVDMLYTLSLSMYLTDGVECTIEANPDSLTLALVRDLWALGVNRMSIGVQSFDDRELAALGRLHDADAARRAVDAARDRFENVSIDLMCGIPGQTLDSFEKSIEQALALDVSHISVYPLAIEEGTPFARMVEAGAIADVDDDFQADCMELAATKLASAGLQRYEVASYAKPGFECRHNTAYWRGVPYVGLGPHAVSMAQSVRQRIRTQDGRVVDRLDAAQMLAEDLMLGMRMTEGLDADLVGQARLVFPEFEAVSSRLVDCGLAVWDGGNFVPTARGWLCGNELYAAMLGLAP